MTVIVLALSTHTNISHSREEREHVLLGISPERRRPAHRSRTPFPGNTTLWVKPVSNGPNSWLRRNRLKTKEQTNKTEIDSRYREKIDGCQGGREWEWG